MSARRSLMILLAALLVFSFACNKPAPPEPPAPAPEPPVERPEPPREVAPPTPTPTNDRTPDPLSGDLLEAQSYAEAQGLLGTVYFEFDRAELSPEARERLAKNAKFLQDRSEFVVTIEGHCDERGTTEYNLALGERRANAALDYMSSLGIPSSRLRTISYGEERGVCSDSSESCWGQNRRAYFRITGRSN